MVDQGFRRITVLDLSETALLTARARLSPDAPVEWVVADVLHWQPFGRFDVWHDRAAFHFLTEASDQDAYLRVMDRALVPSGSSRNWRPSSSRSAMKSIDQTWFGASGTANSSGFSRFSRRLGLIPRFSSSSQ